MNTASLELCKELFKLSGWITEAEYWDADNSKPTPSYQLGWYDENITLQGFISAYPLGYLLRKLPKLTSITQMANGRWAAMYIAIIPTKTPEDAAAKLAIELFKQGVLK